MSKFLNSTVVTLGLIIGSLSSAQSAESLVEIRLVADLDDARGYCLDVAGGQGKRAPIEKGLQAHTCYDYKGVLLEDQAFDSALIAQNSFKIPYFDVCMTASSMDAGATLMLSKCEDLATQHFSLEANGDLLLKGEKRLCVTASDSEKREGRGGEPVHVMRPLSLQNCTNGDNPYQSWTTFSF